MVRSNIYNVKLEPGKLYNFRVAAVNQGGESFPSETLSALYNPTATNKILIVNNFHRLASPQVVDNDSIQGFDFDQDPGVSYGLTAGWSGKQRVFDIHRMGIESSSGLGYSGNEMAGQFVAGNDSTIPWSMPRPSLPATSTASPAVRAKPSFREE